MNRNQPLPICHPAVETDRRFTFRGAYFIQLSLLLALTLFTSVHAAMLPDSKTKKWPANPTKHVITIKRDAADAKQARLISAAEAANPDTQGLKKAIGDGPAPADASQWWYREDLGIRMPYALTGDAVSYYSKLVEDYGKQEMERYTEPSSKFDYHATVAHHDEFELDGKKFKNVDVVTLKLSFSEQFSATTTEAMDFEKERTVVLDSTGKVLAISGDGVTEAPILAI